MATRNDITVLWSLSPRIITVAAPSTEVTIQDLHDTLRNLEDEPHNMTHNSLISTAGKESLGGGVTVGLTATLQNAVLSFESRQTTRTSGTVTTGDSTGRILTDSAGTFVTDSVTQGDWLVNITDGSGASVLFINSETEIVTDILDGGTDNQFDSTDVYRIWPVIQVGVSGGNLVAIDALGADLDPILPTFGTQVVRTSSSSATLQELLDIQFSSFNGGVTVDILSVYSGTFYPRGTPREPVNNFADALSIATTRGFTSIYIIGNATVGSGAFQNFNFIGSGVTETVLTINTIAQVDGASFSQAKLDGTIDGDVVIDSCVVDNLSFVDGTIQNSTLIGTVTLSGSQDASLINCRDGTPGNDFPHINMNGTGSALNVRNWAGGIRIRNKTGPEAVAIDMISGDVILDSDVTSGTITVRGVGTIVDNSTGTTILNTSGLISKSDLLQQIVPGVYIDVTSGVSGTAEGVGLPQTPSNNLVDAKAIADRDGYRAYYFRGAISLDQAYTNWLFVGASELQSTLDLNSQDVDGSRITDSHVHGIVGSGRFEVVRGKLEDVAGFDGVARFSGIKNTNTFAANAVVVFHSCMSEMPAGTYPKCTLGVNNTFSVRNWSGGIELQGSTSGCISSIDLDPGEAIIGPTNTGGTVLVRGGQALNTSTATVTEEDSSSNLAFLIKYSENRLEVDFVTQELILYDDDQITPLRRWPIQTSTGALVTTSDGVQTKRKASVI